MSLNSEKLGILGDSFSWVVVGAGSFRDQCTPETRAPKQCSQPLPSVKRAAICVAHEMFVSFNGSVRECHEKT